MENEDWRKLAIIGGVGGLLWWSIGPDGRQRVWQSINELAIVLEQRRLAEEQRQFPCIGPAHDGVGVPWHLQGRWRGPVEGVHADHGLIDARRHDISHC